MRVPRKVGLALAVLLLLPAAGAAAPRAAAEQAKIDWLLAEVGSSDARFVRNGKAYEGRKAASHLRRKLSIAGSRVRTAREFIVGIASRSEETRRPYELRWPGGRKKLLGVWLAERLVELERRQEGVSATIPGDSSTLPPRLSPQ